MEHLKNFIYLWIIVWLFPYFSICDFDNFAICWKQLFHFLLNKYGFCWCYFVLVHQDVLHVIWFAMTWINPNVDIDGWMLMQFLVDYMWYFISIFHNVSYSSKFQVNLFRLKNKNKNFTFVQFNISNDFVICIMFGNG